MLSKWHPKIVAAPVPANLAMTEVWFHECLNCDIVIPDVLPAICWNVAF